MTTAGIPVVAYPEAAWATPWRDVVTITGEALGKDAEAEADPRGSRHRVADAAAEHPEFAGTTIAVLRRLTGLTCTCRPTRASRSSRTSASSRPPSVTELDTGESTFYTTVSSENLDQIDAEVVLTFVEQQSALDDVPGVGPTSS